MEYIVNSVKKVCGAIDAPASKSYAQRAILANFLAKMQGRSGGCVVNVGCSDDVVALSGAVEALASGADVINVGESGLACRLLVPLMPLMERRIKIEGRGTILVRSMVDMLADMRSMGVEIGANEGRLPIVVGGYYQGCKFEVDGAGGSQFLSGLLFALPLRSEDSVVGVAELKSWPYVDMTLEVLEAFGVEVENRGYKEFRIKGGQKYRAIDYVVEGDWSGASTILVAGAVMGSVVVRGLKRGSRQADVAMLEVLERVGACVEWGEDGELKVSKGELRGFEFDATNCPDLFCALVTLAVFCEGETRVFGAKRLINKESNRAEALVEEFGKMGANVSVEGDVMIIEGGRALKGTRIDSRNDHRIAMACAVAGLAAQGKTVIGNAQCVGKSYGDFYKDLESLLSNE